MSDRVQKLLTDIKHPNSDLGNMDYSFTFDQNILNAVLVELSQSKMQLSLRHLLSLLDQKGTYLHMLSTKLLALNMPELLKDYGSDNQLDILISIDQNKFLTKNKNSPISGFTIDESGNFKTTFNTVSYMKVAANHIKTQKFESVNEGDDDEEDEDTESADLESSTYWPIARTIFSTMTVTGRVALE